jgi:zinc protease
MPRRIWTIRALLGSTLCAAAIVTACARTPPAPAGQALPAIPYEKYTLPNGLEVILSEDHRLPLVAVDIWYHVGPANETAGRTGFAHLFEHMMFQGSKHVPGDSHFRLLEAAGATSVNGTTDFDRTNYFETLPANQLELGLWLESDRMGYLLDTLDEPKLANQQDVVRNELRQSYENRPYGVVSLELFRQVFPKGHPYYGDVIGSHADIQAAKLADVKQFFKQYYTPNNASLAIAGDFDKSTIRSLVEKYFGPLKRGPEVPAIHVDTPPITAERREVVKDRVQLSRVYMAWITPPFFKPGDSEADAAASALGGGDSSRLYKALVYDKQIAQDVSASQNSMALASMFEITATVRPGHTPQEVESAIDQELERFRRDGPDEKEVERARNTFETTMLEGLENLGGFGGVADTLNMFNQYVHDPGYLPKYIQEHRQLTPAAVKGFADKYLTPTSRVVLYAVPGTPDLGPTVPTPPMPKVAAGTGAESVNADAAWRDEPPKPGPERPLTVTTPSTFTLPNGLSVVYQVRSGMPISSAVLVVKSGSADNPVDRPGLANFVADMLPQGTTTRDALTIANDAAQLGAALNTTSTKDATSASVTSLTRNFGSALNLLADVTLNPNFPSAEVERQRASRLANLIAATQDPMTVASMAAIKALYGPNHPYGYIELGDEAAIKATTRDDLVNFWHARFAPGNAALVVAGSMQAAELRPLVEQAFGSWAGTAAPEQPLPAPATTKDRLIVVNAPGAPQTAVIVGTIGPPRSTPDYPSIKVMNAALGGLFSSRINLNLREAHGYTYGASSQFVFRNGPGPFFVSSGVRTDVTGPAVQEILKELTRIGQAPLSADELKMSKDALVHELPSAFETSASAVNTFADLLVYRLGLDYYSKYPAQISSVTADEALGAAKKYLDPKKMVVVAVGDRAKIAPGLRGTGLFSTEAH